MVRRKIKGTKVRRALKKMEEPDFYDPKWNEGGSSEVELVASVASEKQSLPHPSPKSTVVVSPPTLPDKNEGMVTPTTWDSFDEVSDNDFWLFDGAGFFDDGILEANATATSATFKTPHATRNFSVADVGAENSIAIATTTLPKTMSAVSLDHMMCSV